MMKFWRLIYFSSFKEVQYLDAVVLFGLITCLSELDNTKIVLKLQNAYFFGLQVAS